MAVYLRQTASKGGLSSVLGERGVLGVSALTIAEKRQTELSICHPESIMGAEEEKRYGLHLFVWVKGVCVYSSFEVKSKYVVLFTHTHTNTHTNLYKKNQMPLVSLLNTITGWLRVGRFFDPVQTSRCLFILIWVTAIKLYILYLHGSVLKSQPVTSEGYLSSVNRKWLTGTTDCIPSAYAYSDWYRAVFALAELYLSHIAIITLIFLECCLGDPPWFCRDCWVKVKADNYLNKGTHIWSVSFCGLIN